MKRGIVYCDGNLPPGPIVKAELWDGVTYYREPDLYNSSREILTPSNSAEVLTPVVGPKTSMWLGLTLEQLNFAYWRINNYKQEIIADISGEVKQGPVFAGTAATNLSMPTNLQTYALLSNDIDGTESTQLVRDRADLGFRLYMPGLNNGTITRRAFGGIILEIASAADWGNGNNSINWNGGRPQFVRAYFCVETNLYYISMPKFNIYLAGRQTTAGTITNVPAVVYAGTTVNNGVVTETFQPASLARETRNPGEFVSAYTEYQLSSYPKLYRVPLGVENPLSGIPYGSGFGTSFTQNGHFNNVGIEMPSGLSDLLGTRTYGHDDQSVSFYFAKGTPYEQLFSVPCAKWRDVRAKTIESTVVINRGSQQFPGVENFWPPGTTSSNSQKIVSTNLSAQMVRYEDFDCLKDVRHEMQVELTPQSYLGWGGLYDETTGARIPLDPPAV